MRLRRTDRTHFKGAFTVAEVVWSIPSIALFETSFKARGKSTAFAHFPWVYMGRTEGEISSSGNKSKVRMDYIDSRVSHCEEMTIVVGEGDN